MCYFLCVALCPKASVERAIEAMNRFDIDLCTLKSNENVNHAYFEPGTHFLVTTGHCDCGHPVGDRRSDRHQDRRGPKSTWSEARQQRWRFEVEASQKLVSAETRRTLLDWKLGLCHALVASGGKWIGVYGAFYESYVDKQVLSLTTIRIRHAEELTDELLQTLPHRTFLQIGKFQAEGFLRTAEF